MSGAYKGARNVTLNKRNSGGAADRRAVPYAQQPSRAGSNMLVRSIKPLSANSAAPPQIQQSGGIFSRLGGGSEGETMVTFANLVGSVESNDLQELCGTIGEVKEISLKMFPSTGKKSAEVLFACRPDALECVEKFNGVTLDGVMMTVTIAEAAAPPPPPSIFDRLSSKPGPPPPLSGSAAFRATQAASYMQQEAPAMMNVREGLFGSMMDGGGGGFQGEYQGGSGFQGGGGLQGGGHGGNFRGGGFNGGGFSGGGFNGGGGGPSFKITMNAQPPTFSGGGFNSGGGAGWAPPLGRIVHGGGGGRGGGGRGGGGRGGGRSSGFIGHDSRAVGNGAGGRGERRGAAPRGGPPKKESTAADLDAELDNYRTGGTSTAAGGAGRGGSKKGKGATAAAPASSGDLDDDMDAYFAAKK